MTVLAATLDQVDQLISAGPLVLAVAVSALAGLVSFASPCVVPLVPGYLSYLAAVVGVEEDVTDRAEPGQAGRTTVRAARLRVVGAAALFVAGFTVVFVIGTVAVLGLTTTLLTNELLLQRIGGVDDAQSGGPDRRAGGLFHVGAVGDVLLDADDGGQVRQVTGHQRHHTGRCERDQAGERTHADGQHQRPGRHQLVDLIDDGCEVHFSAASRWTRGCRSWASSSRRNTAATRCLRSNTTVDGMTVVGYLPPKAIIVRIAGS